MTTTNGYFFQKSVHPAVSWGMMAFLMLSALFLFYVLLKVYPAPLVVEVPAQVRNQLGILFWTIQIPSEIRLAVAVLIAGAAGGTVRALWSGFDEGHWWYTQAWIMYSLLTPIVGAGLALVFYLVIRGGFFASSATIDETSPFAFIALGILGGLFSDQAMSNLKKIAETVFREAPGLQAPEKKPNPEAEASPANETRAKGGTTSTTTAKAKAK